MMTQAQLPSPRSIQQNVTGWSSNYKPFICAGGCQSMRSGGFNKLPRIRSTTWPSEPQYRLWIDSTNLPYKHICNRIDSTHSSRRKTARDETMCRPINPRALATYSRLGKIALLGTRNVSVRIQDSRAVGHTELGTTESLQRHSPPSESQESQQFSQPATPDQTASLRLPSSLGMNSFCSLLYQIENPQVSSKYRRPSTQRALLELRTHSRQPALAKRPHSTATFSYSAHYKPRSDVATRTPSPTLSTTYHLN